MGDERGARGLGPRAVPDDVMDLAPVGPLVERYARMAQEHAEPGESDPPIEPLSHAGWMAQRWATRIPLEFRTADRAALDGSLGAEVDRWAAADPSPNLVLFGPVGAGKTFAAVAALRLAHDAGGDVEFWPYSEMQARLRVGGPEGELERLCDIGTLLLDDVGMRADTDWAAEMTYVLVNRRRVEGRPIVATTNLHPAEGKGLYAAVGERTWSRLVGGAVVVALGGRDRRRSG